MLGGEKNKVMGLRMTGVGSQGTFPEGVHADLRTECKSSQLR